MTYISQIHTQAGPFKHSQEEILELFRPLMKVDEDRRYSLLFKQIKKHSGIHYRHSVYEKAFLAEGKICSLSTAERQMMYEKASGEIIQKICQNKNFQNVQNVVTVSCTGYQTPGIDFTLIETLNLSKTVQRYHIGAMGCYAGIVGLRLADKLPGNTLLLCLELCSLHFQTHLSFSSLSSNSLFADGAALIEIKESDGKFKLLDFHSEQVPNTLEYMSWHLRDTGFVMGLSTEVPKVIESNLKSVVENWLQQNNLKASQINDWIVHPGGAGVLKAVQKALELQDEQLQESWNILQNYGNMSSGTVFFILQQLQAKPKGKIVMMAFGPGLTVELALLEGENA